MDILRLGSTGWLSSSINPNEALFIQDIVEGTITIDKVEQTGISDKGVRYMLLEGSYSFLARRYNSAQWQGGEFHYEGESDFYR